jgi:hypothetical protein
MTTERLSSGDKANADIPVGDEAQGAGDSRRPKKLICTCSRHLWKGCDLIYTKAAS